MSKKKEYTAVAKLGLTLAALDATLTIMKSDPDNFVDPTNLIDKARQQCEDAHNQLVAIQGTLKLLV